MPLYRRKVAFSGKKKKSQLQARKSRKPNEGIEPEKRKISLYFESLKIFMINLKNIFEIFNVLNYFLYNF